MNLRTTGLPPKLFAKGEIPDQGVSSSHHLSENKGVSSSPKGTTDFRVSL